MNNVVIVESPAKASTIKRYLGGDYEVLASYGHVRDLEPKDGSVRPEEDFALTWSVMPRASKRLNEIVKAVKGADRLLLATDPDREGEAIAWHLLEELSSKKGVLDGVEVGRIAFNAITKNAVSESLRKPRRIDADLVNSYLARRALDYLVGFTLSPVLWRKLPGSRSAGRVQSVALRVICNREAEREIFEPQEYWTIAAELQTEKEKIEAALAALDGEKIEKFTIKDAAAAAKAREAIKSLSWRVKSVEKKPTKRNPSPPFTTSTLQQEAVRKLKISAKEVMRAAQTLYEGKGAVDGLITYMRTDAVQVTPQALQEIRKTVAGRFGESYLPEKPYLYKTRAKNAQEAHEAIRPTDLLQTPEKVRSILNPTEHSLYTMIWKRTVASQMEAARLERSTLLFADSEEKGHLLRATGQRLLFDGFLKLYRREDEEGKEDKEQSLPPLKEGEPLKTGKVEETQHFTQPPPRFTEASLVKRMEEIGIGRPSTYAPILSLLRDRNYVTMERGQFVPESRGRVVTAFLEEFFARYIGYDFTADMESKLDEISAGEDKWKNVLNDFWKSFKISVEDVKDLRISEVLDKMNDLLGRYVFPPREDGKDPRLCTACAEGTLNIKVGRFGAFVGCSRYPDCRHTRPLTSVDGEQMSETRSLGKDPESGAEIFVKSGRFGPYVEREALKDDKKPKRSALPKTMLPQDVDLEKALALLMLPRLVGEHPETGKEIRAGLGRYGPYVLHDGIYASIGKDEDVLTIGLNRSVALLAEKKARGGHRQGARSGKVLGAHPQDKAPVYLRSGRYGPYVSHGRVNATIPETEEPETITLERALALLEERRKKPLRKKTAAKRRPKAKRAPKAKTQKQKEEKQT